jgi:hypothetical protein
MHTLNGNSPYGDYLVHSTNLQKSALTNLGYKVINPLSSLSGPAVLLPRVGIPKVDKLCLLGVNEKVVLSDCVLAIKTSTEYESNMIRSALLDNWTEFSKIYKGTGAKYTTVSRLKTFLGIE